MQQEVELDLMCLKHGEKISQDNLICSKCLMQKHAQQLIDLRSQQMHNLQQQECLSKKRLGSLKTLFKTIKDQFNQQIDIFLTKINDRINQMIKKIKSETELLQQPIQYVNLTYMINEITELKNQIQQKDTFIDQDIQLKNQVILQYLELVKQFNKQFKQITNWKRDNDISKNDESQKQKDVIKLKNQQIEQPQIAEGCLSEYPKFQSKQEIFNCLAMTMDLDEKILVDGKSEQVQVWNFDSFGILKLKQTLNGHTSDVRSLCFSQKGDWFISGSKDKTIRIWQKEPNDQWICSQILEEAHKDWVLEVLINNKEDQLISCSWEGTIKVWMRQKNGIQWECLQLWALHSFQAYFLSLSPNSKLLALSGDDRLIIWSMEEDQVWKQRQVIKNSIQDNYLRIKFIDNHEFIASEEKKGKLIRFSLNRDGLFQIASKLKLNQIKEVDVYCFPIIYNQSSGLAIVRHGRDYIYILKRQENGEFIIKQKLEFDYRAGYLIKNGEFLILYNVQRRSIDVLK